MSRGAVTVGSSFTIQNRGCSGMPTRKPRRRLTNRGFAAKWAGRCDVCGKAINVGDLITGAPGAYSHKGCTFSVTVEKYKRL